MSVTCPQTGRRIGRPKLEPAQRHTEEYSVLLRPSEFATLKLAIEREEKRTNLSAFTRKLVLAELRRRGLL